MDPNTHKSRRRLVRAAVYGVATVAILAVGITQVLLADGEARCVGACKPPPFEAAWTYQLQGTPQITRAVVYDVDGFDTPASFVSRLHKFGRYAVCYISAGTWEDWRPDRSRFPDSVLGRSNGWPGERWLDIRRIDVLTPIMRDRISICKSKGFDAVEPDNVDGFTNDTGFPLTDRHQVRYNKRLALLAHNAGMAVGLKNDLEQVTALRNDFDFAVVEQCFQYQACGKLVPFIDAGKPVFEVEYELPRSSFCDRARKLRINAQRTNVDLSKVGAVCR